MIGSRVVPAFRARSQRRKAAGENRRVARACVMWRTLRAGADLGLDSSAAGCMRSRLVPSSCRAGCCENSWSEGWAVDWARKRVWASGWSRAGGGEVKRGFGIDFGELLII